jgi:large conductance mechanosensitive channel
MALLKEFREFAMKGNVVDLAVGVIIGVAFGAIVKSLVDDVLMPPLGWLTGGLDFADKALIIQHKGANHLITGRPLAKDVVWSYGRFINAVIQFLIQAFAIFMLVKGMNALRRKQENAPTPPPGPTPDQKLLAEIRDAIKARAA